MTWVWKRALSSLALSDILPQNWKHSDLAINSWLNKKRLVLHSKVANLLKICPIILWYPLADCFEFRACLAGRCLCSQNINKYSNKPTAKGYIRIIQIFLEDLANLHITFGWVFFQTNEKKLGLNLWCLKDLPRPSANCLHKDLWTFLWSLKNHLQMFWLIPPRLWPQKKPIT